MNANPDQKGQNNANPDLLNANLDPLDANLDPFNANPDLVVDF